MERSPFFGLIALLCLVMFPSCGDKPHDPAGKDVWTILWANEVNSDPVGPVGYSMGNFGWYGFYDDYTGYKLDYDFTNINAPSSSILTLKRRQSSIIPCTTMLRVFIKHTISMHLASMPARQVSFLEFRTLLSGVQV